MTTTMASVNTIGCKNSANVSTSQNNSSKVNDDADDFMTTLSEIVNSASKKSEIDTKPENMSSEEKSKLSQEKEGELTLAPIQEEEDKLKTIEQAYLRVPIEFVLNLPNEASLQNVKVSQDQPVQSMQNINTEKAVSPEESRVSVEFANSDAKTLAKTQEGFNKILEGVNDLNPVVSDKAEKVELKPLKDAKVENQAKETLTDISGNGKNIKQTENKNFSQQMSGLNTDDSDELKASKILKTQDLIKLEEITESDNPQQTKEIKTESGKAQNQDKGFGEGFGEGFDLKQKVSAKKTEQVDETKKDTQLNFVQPKIQVEKASEKIVLDVKTTESVNVADQVSKQISTVIKEGDTSFKMRLNPEGLGEINVSMICKNGKVSLEIVASNQETGQLLQNQSHELKSALGAKNYEVLNLNVISQTNTSGQANNSFAFFSENSFNNGQQYKQNSHNFNNIINEAGDETINFIPIDQSGRLNYMA